MPTPVLTPPRSHNAQTASREDSTSLLPKKLAHARPLFDPEIVKRAIKASFAKLNPVTLLKNPVMFVVEVGAALTTIFLIRDMFTGASGVGSTVSMGSSRRRRPPRDRRGSGSGVCSPESIPPASM